MARKAKQDEEIEDFFQSFVAIFCNIVGCLVFIIIFIAILISQVRVAILIPRFMPRQMPVSLYFECANKNIYYIDMDAIKQVVSKRMEEAGNISTLGDVTAFIDKANFDTESYTVDKAKVMTAVIEVKRLPEAKPVDITLAYKTNLSENLEQPIETPPKFWLDLQRVKKEKGLIYFIIRPGQDNENLKVFANIHPTLKGKGFEYVGWELRQSENTPIRLSVGK